MNKVQHKLEKIDLEVPIVVVESGRLPGILQVLPQYQHPSLKRGPGLVGANASICFLFGNNSLSSHFTGLEGVREPPRACRQLKSGGCYAQIENHETSQKIVSTFRYSKAEFLLRILATRLYVQLRASAAC